MTPPKNTKYMLAFVGIVNNYKDMWSRQSHLLHPLTAITSNKAKFKCTDVEKKLLMISSVLSPATPISRPEFQ